MDLKARAEELLGRRIPKIRIIKDSGNFMRLMGGDILEADGRRYVLGGHTFEGRFGLNEQPKQWVWHARDFADGSAKIIKFVFHEDFNLTMGGVRVHCYRSPEKESRVLALVKGHKSFMQGVSLADTAGNDIRVLDRINGRPMNHVLDEIAIDHETYFHTSLKARIKSFLPCLAAIDFLHENGEVHGDIRRDHIYVENATGRWRWIDFDYSYDAQVNPFGLDLFGLGNVICYLVGNGIPNMHFLTENMPHLLPAIDPGDRSIILTGRVFNLRKVYPYIPRKLNRILMHFSGSAEIYYDNVDEIFSDLGDAMSDLPHY